VILDSRSPITIFSIVLLVLLMVGVWVTGHLVGESERKNETLQLNEEKWAANKPLLYSYIVSSGCMWVDSYKIEKTESGLLSIPIDNSPTVAPINVDDLFAEARKANLTSHKASITYHPYFGFPTLIDVDWEKEAIDDECFIKVGEFKALDKNET